MPPQPKTPQATPLVDAHQRQNPNIALQGAVEETFARQLETLCHALAGALKSIKIDFRKVCRIAKEYPAENWDGHKDAVAALETYRALTSADERRGG